MFLKINECIRVDLFIVFWYTIVLKIDTLLQGIGFWAYREENIKIGFIWKNN
jgi:hypothetical protein